MVVLRFCSRRFVNVAVKFILSVFLFVAMAQFTYLHTYIVEESRAEYTKRLTQIPERTELQDNLTSIKAWCSQIARNSVPPLISFPDGFFQTPFQPLLYGKPKHKKGYLSIGVPSVRRPNTDRIYLYDTLDSLLEKIPETEHHQITIVVMVSDTNKTYNKELSARVYERYKAFCDNGMIHIINTFDCIYPDLDNVKQTFNDSQSRLKWRAKQNIDFAFMMLYSRNLSDFYIQLEDDVIVATDFIQDIRTVIAKRSHSWFLLEFSRLGFIGKLFRSSDLEFASMFLLKHYDLAPCDFLLIAMRYQRGQRKPFHVNQSLFQHIGRFSSLKNKLMPALDRTFKDGLGIDLTKNGPIGDNPPAWIITSLIAYRDHVPKHAYNNDSVTYFWAKTPRKDDHFTLSFDQPYNFSRIVIITGAVGTKKDSFFESTLLYSETVYPVDADKLNITPCVNRFSKLEDLVYGEIDTEATGTVIPNNIICLRILATESIKNWIIIRDIQLFVKH